MAGPGEPDLPMKRRPGSSGRLTQLAIRALPSVLALALVVVALSPERAQAQAGQGAHVVQRAGPYQIEVITTPSALSLGRVSFIVVVREAATQQPVPDARVLVYTEGGRQGKTGWAVALNNPETPERYQAVVKLDDPGTWQAQVAVASSLGEALVPVPPLEVPGTRRYTAGTLVFVGVLATILLGVGYVWWSARRQRLQGNTPR